MTCKRTAVIHDAKDVLTGLKRARNTHEAQVRLNMDNRWTIVLQYKKNTFKKYLTCCSDIRGED